MSWLRQNDTLDMANQFDQSQAFSKSDSVEVQVVESQSRMIDAIRNEHARVYLQDQALLKTIKEYDGSHLGGVDPKQLSMRDHEGPAARMDLLGQPGNAMDENRSQDENDDPAQQQTDENGNNGVADENEDEAQSN